MPIIVGILVVVLTFYVLRSFTQASPAVIARLLKGWAGFMALALGGLMLVRGVQTCGRCTNFFCQPKLGGCSTLRR